MKRNTKYFFVVQAFVMLISLFASSSCQQNQEQNHRKIVAQVQDHVLYWDEVKEFIPDYSSGDDSSQIVGGFVKEWVLHKLKLRMAEQNLETAQKDLSKELEDYRSSLLIYKYEQEYIKQNLDTFISDEDLKSYYEGFKPELLLEKPVVKCAYVILPLEAPDYFSFKTKFRYNYDKKLAEINSYCEANAEAYFHQEEDYLYFDELRKRLPLKTDIPENFLKYNRFVELEDDKYKYLVNIFDYKLKSDIAPLNIVKNEIRSILLNKRKIKLIRNLEESI
ncbi:hypothetical protein, partial [Candidatus Venteria ishoeyi]|uniref:hypothetical protein n=1 Tax=Candidatus Venteria ishoeyi TaxID=1899563 RepID=UPI0011B02952